MNIKNNEQIALNSDYDLASKGLYSSVLCVDKGIVIIYNKKKNSYGLINSCGEMVLDDICTTIESLPDNGYWRVLINDEWVLFKEDIGLINPKSYLDFSLVEKN